MTAPRRAVVAKEAVVHPPAPIAAEHRDERERKAILEETARFTDPHQVYGDPHKAAQGVALLRRYIKDH